MKYEHKLEKIRMCPIEYGLEVFGGICVISSQASMRYSEIKRELTGITDAVLAAMLKEMLADGLVERRQYNEIPPRVEYLLSDKGHSVLPLLQSICAWSRAHAGEELDSRLPSCTACQHLRC